LKKIILLLILTLFVQNIELFSQKQKVQFFNNLGISVKLFYDKPEFYTNYLSEYFTILYVDDDGFENKWEGIQIDGSVEEGSKLRIYHDVSKNSDLMNNYFQEINEDKKYPVSIGFIGSNGKFVKNSVWCEIPLSSMVDGIISDTQYDSFPNKKLTVTDTPGRLVGNHSDTFLKESYIITIVEIVDKKGKVQYRGGFLLTNQNLWDNY
jgi:hypothetical protein